MTDRQDQDRPQDLEFLLCEYLDGELPRRRRRELDKRLEADEALREELRKYTALEARLGDLGGEEVEGIDYDLQRAEIVAAVEKRALLQAPRPRPIYLRPVFGALAAAASILLIISVGAFLLRPAAPPAGRLVEVQIKPAAPLSGRLGAVRVELKRPNYDELPLAPDVAAVADAPPGTVVVSIGPDLAPAATPAEALMVY
jgi:anti-sigma factor RsiW